MPDVVILDRLLRQHDSLAHLKDIKESFPAAKVLILSAINTSNEKASALDLGADDYLGKPFSTTELLARVRALSRRLSAQAVPTHLRCGNLVLDIAARSALVGERKLNLPNKEFLVLRALAQQPGRVLKKATLVEQIWESSVEAETNVVEATITNLRRKLEDTSANVKIKNMRNAGYWIEV